MMELQQIADSLRRIESELHTVKRGVYGDEPNGVKGLIKTDIEQHQRIKKLEERDKKYVYIGTGIVVCAEALHWLLDFVK